MEIGDLRHRITLQKLVTTVNDSGFEEMFGRITKPLGGLSNLHGREYYAAAAVQAENTVKFTIRYLPDIDTAMRISFRDKSYDIKAIDNIRYQNRFIEIKAQEVKAGG